MEMARSQRWVPGCPPRDGSQLLETPTHSFVDGRKPVQERRSLCPRPPALMVTVVVGSFLPQGRRGHLSFLFGAPHLLFLSPL